MNTMLSSVASFYDDLAPHYHLLYRDWEHAVAEQGNALAALFSTLGVTVHDPILDAACGIGTQTLGLAQLGFNIAASDISPVAIKRLQRELVERGLDAQTRVDDLRTLADTESSSVAAILACDNSIPHLLSDDEILQAFLAARRCLRPGGVLVISARDYAALPRISPDVRPYGLQYREECRFLAVQVWEWQGEQYDLRMYLTCESSSGECTTKVLRSRYYAISLQRLQCLLTEAGFVDVVRHDNVLFQPVLTARRHSSLQQGM
jgi:SAM-dependent methyltransferase